MAVFFNPVLIGGLAGGLGVIAYALMQPRRHCPKCAQLLPLTRLPKTAREVLLGGWHCPKCNAKIDRKGSMLSNQ